MVRIDLVGKDEVTGEKVIIENQLESSNHDHLGKIITYPISVFEAIVEMAEVCKEVDPESSPYKLDKIIWLICSGRFYLDDISVGRHKDDFIKYVKDHDMN